MRSVRSELSTLAAVMVVPACVVAIFPYEALRFRPAEKLSRSASLASVELSPETRRQAMRTARTSLRDEGNGVRWMRADLSYDLLPDDPRRPVLTDSLRAKPAELPLVSCGRTPYLPSQCAAPAAKIAPDGESDAQQAFSRQELLKIE